MQVTKLWYEARDNWKAFRSDNIYKVLMMYDIIHA